MKFDRKKAFDGFRKFLLSKRKPLNQGRVDGIEYLLTAFENDGIWSDVRHIAYAFATICVETAWTFHPIKEIGPNSYFDKYDGRSSLGNFKKGDGAWFKGRGYVQITGRRNYTYFAKELGIDLIGNPQLALDPKTSFLIMTIGMFRGTFTGKDLFDYINDRQTDYVRARRIINGNDKAHTIALYAEAIEKLLRNAIVDETLQIEEFKPEIPDQVIKSDSPNGVANQSTNPPTKQDQGDQQINPDSAPSTIETEQTTIEINDEGDVKKEETSVFETLNKYGTKINEVVEKNQTTINQVSKVSKSSQAVTVATKIGGWALLVWGVIQDHFIEILFGAFLVAVAVWYFKFAKDRQTERIKSVVGGNGIVTQNIDIEK